MRRIILMVVLVLGLAACLPGPETPTSTSPTLESEATASANTTLQVPPTPEASTAESIAATDTGPATESVSATEVDPTAESIPATDTPAQPTRTAVPSSPVPPSTPSSGNGGEQTTDGVTVRLTSTVLAFGETRLEAFVVDANNRPIPVQTFAVRGDMTHPGMAPTVTSVVAGDIDTETAGLYRIPFVWTMAGDWIITLTTVLADGREIEQEFTFSVGGG